MGPPVRLICIDCLQSIEISVAGSTSEPSHCPHCGCYLDPFEQGIQSRANLDFNSPLTVDFGDASTLRNENLLFAKNRRVDRFEIRLALGEGGYGQVFRAFDPHLEREVALKVLKPNRLGEKALERFYREARAAARLDHPNIVALHDAGRDEGRCWIAYQLVTGRTLSVVRDLTPPSILDSIRIVRDLALALDHAHGRGVFHRDLKPANIMIDDAGRPRLTDFGLARRDDINSDLTKEGTVLGTPQYMSPEAAAGRAHEADARSDVYSLGVILYELLCGRRPCDLPSASPLWRSTHFTSPVTPHSVDRAIPIALDRICMKALALNPADRLANASLLADALTEQIQNYRSPRSRKSIERTVPAGHPQTSRQRGLAVASTCCLALLAVVFLVLRPQAAAVGPSGAASSQVPPAPPVAEAGPPALATPSVAAVTARPSAPNVPTAPSVVSTPESSLAVDLPVASPPPTAFYPFVAPKKGRYHCSWKNCVQGFAISRSFKTKAEAESQGFKPCGTCHPEHYPDLLAPPGESSGSRRGEP